MSTTLLRNCAVITCNAFAPALRGQDILITGPEKRAALERAFQLPAMDAPINVVLDQATIHWAE